MENGRINVKINNIGQFEAKQLQFLGTDLAVKGSMWIKNDFVTHTVAPGTYLVRLNVISGEQYEQIAVVEKAGVTNLDFDPPNASSDPDQFPEYRKSPKEPFLEKLVRIIKASLPVVQMEMAAPVSVNFSQVRLWILKDKLWSSRLLPEIDLNQIGTIEKTFSIESSGEFQLLELDNPSKPLQYITLPPSQDIKCHIKRSSLSSGAGAYDVTLKIAKQDAQALLSLMTSGDMARAKSLDDAEVLLFEKQEDPVAAAIGGYYLLKTRSLERLHSWPNNLANWYGWLPDGCIIHAWQMIMDNNGYNNNILIRSRLLEAVERGMPVFTEGLRLLYEGLAMCSFDFGIDDTAIRKALNDVKDFLSNTDMSKETTSYTGNYPDLPTDARGGNLPPPTLIPPIHNNLVQTYSVSTPVSSSESSQQSQQQQSLNSIQ